MAGEQRLVDFGCLDEAGRHPFRQSPCRGGNLLPASVVEGDDQGKTAVGLCPVLRLLEQGEDIGF